LKQRGEIYMLQITQLKVRVRLNKTDLTEVIANKLNIQINEILHYTIDKRSIDARKKEDIFFVYTVLVDVKNESKIISKNIANVSVYETPENIDYSTPKIKSNKKIAIIGFGPAGMFSALSLSMAGLNVTVFERGEEVDKRIKTITKCNSERVLNPESNIQFGEGGAGTFSDGKLTNRSKDKRAKWLFEELVKAGAPEEILYVHNPHIGTDNLIHVVKNIRKTIIDLGSKIVFNSKVTNIEPKNNSIELTINGKVEIFDYVILAIGHSSRDTIEMLYNNNCNIEQKPFAVGFRIEHKQESINRAQFGVNYNNESLGAAEYKLTHQTKDKRGVYTFCMCPGGWVVPAASEEGMLVVNGMSEYHRDRVNANSALLVSVDSKDFRSSHPLAGIQFQRELERKAFELGGKNYSAPIQTVGDFINNKTTTKLGFILPSYSIGVTYSNLRSIFSEQINRAFIEAFEAMGKRMKGFDHKEAVLTGVESRSSSPVRIVRDLETLQSTNFKNLYPTGEGAGYAGGIVSAAIDGLKVSEKILEQLKSNE